MPFYTRGLDGRIDDPNADWKGREDLDEPQLRSRPETFLSRVSAAADPLAPIPTELIE